MGPPFPIIFITVQLLIFFANIFVCLASAAPILFFVNPLPVFSPQAMVFITVLLFIFAYIFAIMGVIFFSQSYDDAVAEGVKLKYTNSFS